MLLATCATRLCRSSCSLIRASHLSSVSGSEAGVGAAWSGVVPDVQTDGAVTPVTAAQVDVTLGPVTSAPPSTGVHTVHQLRKGGRVAAPWPFVDASRPAHLPKRISREASPVTLDEAIKELQHRATSRRRHFVEGVEAVLQLSVDTRRGDQAVRGSTLLPHGTGSTKRLRVCVFADGPDAQIARAAGADLVGGDELIASILTNEGKSLPFDRCLCTPAVMKRVAQLGRILGPRGLMPNVKMGTLTTDVARTLQEIRGRLDFRVDRGGNLHAGIGKVSMSAKMLSENLGALMKSVLESRPSALASLPKSEFLRAAYLKGTMTATVPVLPSSLLQLAAITSGTSAGK